MIFDVKINDSRFSQIKCLFYITEYQSKCVIWCGRKKILNATIFRKIANSHFSSPEKSCILLLCLFSDWQWKPVFTRNRPFANRTCFIMEGFVYDAVFRLTRSLLTELWTCPGGGGGRRWLPVQWDISWTSLNMLRGPIQLGQGAPLPERRWEPCMVHFNASWLIWPPWTEWQTWLKTLPSLNFVGGGKKWWTLIRVPYLENYKCSMTLRDCAWEAVIDSM